jgi:hypothetical protein
MLAVMQLRRRWSRRAVNLHHCGRMICRSHTSDASDDFQKLRAALRAGMTALADPNVATRVRKYFEDNPSFSRDAAHVAAIACRLASEKVSTDAPARAATGAPSLSPRP